jgi:hypothetical protein
VDVAAPGESGGFACADPQCSSFSFIDGTKTQIETGTSTRYFYKVNYRVTFAKQDGEVDFNVVFKPVDTSLPNVNLFDSDVKLDSSNRISERIGTDSVVQSSSKNFAKVCIEISKGSEFFVGNVKEICGQLKEDAAASQEFNLSTSWLDQYNWFNSAAAAPVTPAATPSTPSAGNGGTRDDELCLDGTPKPCSYS